MSGLLRGQHSPVTEADAAELRAAGLWRGRTLRSVLADAAASHPDRVAAIGYRADAPTSRMTYRELDTAAHQVAVALATLGVRPGDVVAVMLPNRVEYPAFAFGVNELGAIHTGIPPAYGELQAAAILRHSGAKVLVVARRWRNADHLALSRSLRAAVPTVEDVLVVDAEPSELVDGETAWSSLDDLPDRRFEDPDPGEVCYLGFTSGTTGAPKGAMHTHETLLHPAEAFVAHLGQDVLGTPAVQLVASPMGHHTGYAWGILMTAWLAGTAVLVDRWDPRWAAEVIGDEQVTCFFGAPTFLHDLLGTDLVDDPACPLACVVVAGSSVPRGLPAKAGRALGAYIAPAWGMTECGILTSCTPAEPSAIQLTDGSPFAGSEVRVVDGSGNDVPPGVTGDLLMRGPGVTVGYFGRPDATDDAFLPGLWFKTGDTASIDEHGWLSIRGRTKDLVIRGGENIPVAEVETLLFEHPDVRDAAVVGFPDERLGERACAVLVLRAGASLDLAELHGYLSAAGLSTHYLPERLMIVDGLPTTPSGKVQKFRLRDLVAAEVERSSAARA